MIMRCFGEFDILFCMFVLLFSLQPDPSGVEYVGCKVTYNRIIDGVEYIDGTEHEYEDNEPEYCIAHCKQQGKCLDIMSKK